MTLRKSIIGLCLLSGIGLFVVLRNHNQPHPAEQTPKRSIQPSTSCFASGAASNDSKEVAPGISQSTELSKSEEDKILQEHNRSPEILSLLAWLGSSRRNEFIKEALSKDPNNRSALFLAFAGLPVDGLDYLTLAEQFSNSEPNETLPGLCLAMEKLKRGDITARESLIQAISRNGFTDFTDDLNSQSIKLLLSYGRNSDQIIPAITLTRPQPEAAICKQIAKQLGFDMSGRPFQNSNPEDVVAALRICQKVTLSKSLDLASQGAMRFLESKLFEHAATLQSADIEKYFPSGFDAASEEAGNAYREIKELVFYATEKEELYRSLDQNSKTEFSWRVQKDGELSAMQWLWDSHREVFSTVVPGGNQSSK